MVKLETSTLRHWLLELPHVFEANLESLNQLDAKAGDGDHGTTMLRGLRASAQAIDGLNGDNARTMLETAGTNLRRAAGGASGPLFSSLFLELGKVAEDDGLDLEGFTSGLSAAIAMIVKLGKAASGDRTMLDALMPAAEAAQTSSNTDVLTDVFKNVVNAARGGMTATASMVARKGRARNVNAGHVESPDAGATSILLILETLKRSVEAT